MRYKSLPLSSSNLQVASGVVQGPEGIRLNAKKTKIILLPRSSLHLIPVPDLVPVPSAECRKVYFAMHFPTSGSPITHMAYQKLHYHSLKDVG